MNIARTQLGILVIFILLFCLINVYILYPKAHFLSAPPYLKKGDLLFCDFNPHFQSFLDSLHIKMHEPNLIPGPHNDHVAMYLGNDMFIEACPYFYDGDANVWTGVVTTHMSTFNLWATNITYGILINVTDEQRENAVNWALQQVGQPYQEKISPRSATSSECTDSTANKWYCTELVWQAYLNQGIDFVTSWRVVTPNALLGNKDIIIKSYNTSGWWYPGFYIQWFFTCFFDYNLDLIFT